LSETDGLENVVTAVQTLRFVDMTKLCGHAIVGGCLSSTKMEKLQLATLFDVSLVKYAIEELPTGNDDPLAPPCCQTCEILQASIATGGEKLTGASQRFNEAKVDTDGGHTIVGWVTSIT